MARCAGRRGGRRRARARGQRGCREYEWKCQSFWQPGTVNQQAFERFAANVAEKSGGRIAIEAPPVDAAVPPDEVLDAVTTNIIQCMNGGTGYFVTKDPAFALLADFNAGYENPEQLTGWFYQGGGIDIERDLYAQYGTYYLGPVLWGAESIPSKMPLRNIWDFQGIQMRSPEGMGAAIWRKPEFGLEAAAGVAGTYRRRTFDLAQLHLHVGLQGAGESANQFHGSLAVLKA